MFQKVLPQHHHLAYKTSKLVAATNPKESWNKTIHLTSTEESLTYTTTDGVTILQTTTPSVGGGEEWALTIETSKVGDLLGALASEIGAQLQGMEQLVRFRAGQDSLGVSLDDTAEGLYLPVADVEYPINRLNHLLDNWEPLPTASFTSNRSSFTALPKVAALFKQTDVTHHLTANGVIFEFDHPTLPVNVRGMIATTAAQDTV